MSARVTTVSAFPDIGGMSAYPDFPLVEDDFPQWEALHSQSASRCTTDLP